MNFADNDFEVNVWGTPNVDSVVVAQDIEPVVNNIDDDDDFGDADFAEPSGSQTYSQTGFIDDDDFGDFGEEAVAEEEELSTNGFISSVSPSSTALPSWEPLRLDPNALPDRSHLNQQISSIIAPLFPENISSFSTPDQIREAEGISQILVTPESRDLYNSLVSSAPPTKPPNWIRSKIRRQQLITLGIPVNLDEVLPTSSSSLPPLQISTRPASNPSSQPASRSGTPQPGKSRSTNPSIGSKPELDQARIDYLLGLDTDSLTIQPLPQLQNYLAEVRLQTAKTSAVLTHLLQHRDALQQDSETYNALIADLVGEAQKMKAGKKPQSRRGSGVT